MSAVLVFFLKAAGATLLLSLGGFLLGFFLLSLACLGAVGSAAFRRIFLLVCRFFQTVPFLILLFWIYFGWGYLLRPLSISPFVAGLVALALSFLCFAGEALVHALDNLRAGLMQSAESLRIRGWALYRWILLPELWAQLGGLISNLMLMLLKESALVSALGLFELTRAAQVYSELSGSYLVGAVISLLIYWGLSEFLQSTLLKRMPRYE